MRQIKLNVVGLMLVLCTCGVHAEYAEIILLGTGTPRPSIERFGSATLVSAGGRYFLFDAGRGVTIRLQQAGITPNLIETVFFTHLHSDHISGLDDLWITGWVWQRENALQVYGPSGTNQLVHNLRAAYAADISYRTANTGLDSDNAYIEAHEIGAGFVYEEAGVTIKSFLVDHKPVNPAFGYRIEFGDRVIVISGDTTYSENLVEQARGADVLVHEITAAGKKLLQRNKRLQQVVAYHTTPEQMIKVLQKSQPRFTALNHVLLFGVDEQTVLSKLRAEYQGEVVIGYDLMKIGVGNRITVNRLSAAAYE